MNLDNLIPANEDDTQSVLVEVENLDHLPLALSSYINRIGQMVDNLSEDDFLKAASFEAEKLVLTDDLLTADQMIPCNETYNRHQLYADPEGRFTVLALVWQPGQFTCIHGHNAWGVVGVRQGAIKVDCFDLAPSVEEPAALIQTATITANPGDVNAVGTAPSGIHRLGNASDEIAITIHTYGMDLSEEPASINVVYSD